ncbi:MAG: SEC-C metal-binding domain-containing protein [Weeksellaceae bacterium]
MSFRSFSEGGCGSGKKYKKCHYPD